MPRQYDVKPHITIKKKFKFVLTPEAAIQRFRNSHMDLLCDKGVLKNFSKFTRKKLCQGL